MDSSFTFQEVIFQSAQQIVDTHCHYNLEPLYPEWQQHWQKAQEHGVRRSIIPGTELETCRRAVEIAEQVSELQALVGIHPGSVTETTESLSEVLEELEDLLQSEKVVGVGEIGLDYFRIAADDSEERESQKAWLRAQLQLAERYAAPVVLHVRDKEIPETPTGGNAYWDTVQALEETGFSGELVLHCVSGPLAYVQQMINKGAFVSFAANVTYPNAHAIREALRLTPRNKMLVETDAPFLPPQEFRGQLCEPWMIQRTAEFLQEQIQQENQNKVQ
jgi:TatD DNase family protein